MDREAYAQLMHDYLVKKDELGRAVVAVEAMKESLEYYATHKKLSMKEQTKARSTLLQLFGDDYEC